MKNFAKVFIPMALVAVIILSVVANTTSNSKAYVVDIVDNISAGETTETNITSEAFNKTDKAVAVVESEINPAIEIEEYQSKDTNVIDEQYTVSAVEDENADEDVNNSIESCTETEPKAKDETNDDNEDKQSDMVIFDLVDEYLYVNTKILNVRVGPSTKCDKITSIKLNTKVHRIGVGSNGWSKIEYDGKEAYVASNYISYKKTHIETLQEEMERRGNVGRLKISSVGLNVALFKASAFGGSQSIVDAKDSAAYMEDAIKCYGQIIIADHVHQGFSAIKKSKPGTTIAHIDFGTETLKYICTKKFIGKNKGSDLVSLDGVSIKGQNAGGICMYTCNSDGTITITYWQPA
jgi:uncharacterized protein YgiM (DUF1202 family)